MDDDPPDAVARKLRDCRLSGFYADGHKYIQKLSSSHRQHTLVAIEAAQLYILQGQYNYAADATYEALGTCSVAINGTRSDEYICFGIIQAFVALMRESKLQTALALADVVLEILPPIDIAEQNQIQSERLKEIDIFSPMDHSSPARVSEIRVLNEL